MSLFNDFEISSPGGKLSSPDYQLFLLAHLVVLDTINCKFLWKRIPKALKSEGTSQNSQVTNEIWGIARAFIKKDFSQGFTLIGSLTKQLSSDAEKHGSILKMLEVLTKVMREHHMVKILRQSFATIDFKLIKSLLGFTPAEADSVIGEFLVKRGMTIEGSYVLIPPCAAEETSKRFTLDQERVSELAQVVQFLEQ